VPAGRTVEIPADAVISAVGNSVDSELFRSLGVPVDARGKAIKNCDTFETELPGVYIAGDAANGPATVAQAIADAIRCVSAILDPEDSSGAGTGAGANTEKYAALNVNPDSDPAKQKKGLLYKDCAQVHDSARCLECATICECCVDVCPNRANISVCVEGRPQIIHIDMLCNECGNCETFCPYSSAPYLDKFTFFTCAEDFATGENEGFLPLGDGSFRIRLDGNVSVHSGSSGGLPNGIWKLIETAANEVGLL